jgi:hypothetical protein
MTSNRSPDRTEATLPSAATQHAQLLRGTAQLSTDNTLKDRIDSGPIVKFGIGREVCGQRFELISFGVPMSKRETIDRIRRLNPTALPEFLAHFEDADLLAYLYQLQELDRERIEHVHEGSASKPMLVCA